VSEPARLAFFGTLDDKAYLPALKSCVGVASVSVSLGPIDMVAEIVMAAKQKQITQVFTSSHKVLELLLADSPSKPSVDNYAGSIFKRQGIEILIIPPLTTLFTVPHGKFLLKRYLSKFTNPQAWSTPPAFSWEILDATNIDAAFARFRNAFLIAVDIETIRENLAITCIGYCGFFRSDDGVTIESHSVVLPCDSEFALAWMRKWNWELTAPKVLQNGKYDCSYLLRYNAPLFNWRFDTLTMMHCWYAELPKDLAFISSFLVRDSMYWKDLAKTGDKQEYYLYNCKDTYQTGVACIEWLLRAPEWAKKNFVLEFPLVFPSLVCEMRGIKRDQQALARQRTLVQSQIAEGSRNLNVMTGASLNVASPLQIKKLLTLLGCGDLPNTAEKTIKKAAFRHPLNARILGKVLEIRKQRKLLGTYLRTDEDKVKATADGSKDFAGRVLYSLNPHGADTGRNASCEHHFWTGVNIQNTPRGSLVKCTFVADEEFAFAEVDLEQAESRGTAYVSGDSQLLTNVNGSRDFHSLNASAFFGVPYERIYSDEFHKTLDKILRDLAKRVNHGANYLMGPNVLVDTMGFEKILEARRLLRLPPFWSFKQIAEYLLAQFHRTYPSLKRVFYAGVVNEIVTTKMLVGATGWTRYCFGDPAKNKSHKNSYVAHVPQSLNAMSVNQSFLQVFTEIQMNPEHAPHFKLLAQIHDSILFQYRIGHEYLVPMVQQAMVRPIEVTGYDLIKRTMIVPAAAKFLPAGATHWSDLE
jgi:DNA polymerase I-like protein with 3'-5' exonuclease and polymerase domains